MKKFLVVMAAIMMTAMSVNAQDEQRSEVGVFYGTSSASNILSVFSTMFSAAVGDQSSWWGPVGVEYYYHLTPVVAVGGVGVIAGCKAIDEKTNEKDLTQTYITLMPSVKFNWLRKSGFGMYSAASAGMMISSVSIGEGVQQYDPEAEDETLATFIFNVTALGVEFGGNLRGFAELGLGEKGVLCAGLRYRF